MTLNSTFLGVLKRLKKDLSSQAEIQLWLHVYEYHIFEFTMIKQHWKQNLEKIQAYTF